MNHDYPRSAPGDDDILDLLWRRSEDGLAHVQRKYGHLCFRIAMNLLGQKEDAEECVNDVYLAVWDTIPPNRPASLMAYVGKITRNIAVDTVRKRESGKRRCGGTVLLDELTECLPDPTASDPADDLMLREALESFLHTLSEEDRAIMLRRYYDGVLDGATRISTIADKALSDGQSAVAITDHGVMYGAVEFYNALKSKGVKPIIGCEVYVAPRGRFSKEGKLDNSGHHLVLLCKDEIGYKNLCYMVSESFINGFYSRPRIDMDLLRDHHEGLIALSGCVGGYIPQLILAGTLSDAEKAALEMKELFGDDFYLEIQNHGMDDERRVAYGLKLIAEKYDIPLVATNDVHYLEKSDADIQATLLCVQTNNVITDGRPFGFETDEYYFKTTDEMKRLFAAFPGAIENTVKIAEKCNFDFTFNQLHLPNFEPEGGLSHKEKLRLDAYHGFVERAEKGRFDFSKYSREAYMDRMEYELSVIDKMGFNAYFLIVSDFVV